MLQHATTEGRELEEATFDETRHRSLDGRGILELKGASRG